MSVTPPTIEIPIPRLWGGIRDTTKGSKKITAALAKAIKRGLTKAFAATMAYAKEIVPESDPAYGAKAAVQRPPSYGKHSEALLDTYLAALQRELRDLKRIPIFGQKVEIEQTGWAEVSYADPVNKMSGVRWTKATSESHFIEKITSFLAKAAFLFIYEEIKQDENLSPDASKYRGT
jgi:hypothetical protein